MTQKLRRKVSHIFYFHIYHFFGEEVIGGIIPKRTEEGTVLNYMYNYFYMLGWQYAQCNIHFLAYVALMGAQTIWASKMEPRNQADQGQAWFIQ